MSSRDPRRRTSPPIVAVTAASRVVEGALRVRLNDLYVRALEESGLCPIVVPPLSTADDAAPPIIGIVDGLVLTGGEDVDPLLYGATPHERLGPVSRMRDETELALFAAARERQLPTLAICRGLQVVNVALGGTLIQDIASECATAIEHNPDVGRDTPVHRVGVDADARLARVLGVTELAVNSIHHQAVGTLGETLRVSARAPDGIVEGIESDDQSWWMLGVQWHPEEVVGTPDPWARRLFFGFAEACRSFRR